MDEANASAVGCSERVGFVVPEGWDETKLGAVATFKGGAGFKESYQGKSLGDLPFIKVSDMNLPGNEQEIRFAQNWIDHHEAKALRASPMPPRSVVFAKVGAALMLNKRRRLVRPTIIDNNMMAAIPDETRITSDYLFLHLKTVDLGKFAQASAVPSVNQQHLAEVPILLPPPPEQRCIVEILSAWDRAIATVEALLANTRVQKRGLLNSLLTGRNRLRGFSGDWRREPLGKLCQISKGEQLGRLAMLADGTVPVINGGIGPSGYTDRANNPGGCITVSEGGNSCGFVSLISEPFWCGGHCYALESLGVDRSFLFAFLKQREAEIMKLRVGSGLPNIQKKDLARFEIVVPSRAEQEAIGEIADTQDREIRGLEGQLGALHAEKAALMQQLLTGKRRVKLDQKEAA
jgi:type I restriction enzyme S subunit